MKFRATMTLEYEVSKADMEKNYGTTDPIEAAKIDKAAIDEEPWVFLEGFGGNQEEITVNVEPIS